MGRLFAALFFLSSCGPPALCTTRCGLELEWEAPEADESWTCENLQRTEDQVVESFKTALDIRFHDTCNRIKGTGVYVVGALSWENAQGKKVAGETFCWNRYVFVYKAEPWNISLPHELAHVVQACSPLEPFDSTDYDHSNWVRDGIYTAIEDVKTQLTLP